MLDPKIGDEFKLEDGTTVSIIDRYGRYNKNNLDIGFSNESAIHKIVVDDLRKFYYYLLERDCSKKTPQEMCDHPEEGDLISTFLYGVIEILRIDEEEGIMIIGLFKNNNFGRISIHHFKEIVDPSLRNIHEVMAYPWPGSVINTKTDGKIKIVNVNGGIYDGVLRIFIPLLTQDIQMTMREFHRRYMGNVIV